MSKEKQIEEMAREMCHLSAECKTCQICNERYHGDDDLCYFQCVAKEIINHGYRKQSEWISVEERLPSEEEYRDEYGELIPILVCEKDTQYPYRAMYDGTEWGDGLMKIRGITHWMPLPEPPKMKGGGE